MLVISADVGLITSLRRGLQTETFFALSLGEFFLAFQLAGHRVRRFPHAVGAGRLLLLRVVQRRTKVAVPQRLHALLGVSGQHSAAVRMPRAFFGSVVHIVGFVVDFSVI